MFITMYMETLSQRTTLASEAFDMVGALRQKSQGGLCSGDFPQGALTADFLLEAGAPINGRYYLIKPFGAPNADVIV